MFHKLDNSLWVGGGDPNVYKFTFFKSTLSISTFSYKVLFFILDSKSRKINIRLSKTALSQLNINSIMLTLFEKQN